MLLIPSPLGMCRRHRSRNRLRLDSLALSLRYLARMNRVCEALAGLGRKSLPIFSIRPCESAKVIKFLACCPMRDQHRPGNRDANSQQRAKHAICNFVHLPPPVISNHGATANSSAKPAISAMAITTARGMRHHSGRQGMGLSMSGNHRDSGQDRHNCD